MKKRAVWFSIDMKNRRNTLAERECGDEPLLPEVCDMNHCGLVGDDFGNTIVDAFKRSESCHVHLELVEREVDAEVLAISSVHFFD